MKKDIDKKEESSVGAGHINKLVDKIVSKKQQEAFEKIANSEKTKAFEKLTQAFAIPEYLMQQGTKKEFDAQNKQDFVHIGVDPAMPYEKSQDRNIHLGNRHYDKFMSMLFLVMRKASNFHARVTGIPLNYRIIHDSYPDEIVIDFHSRCFSNKFVIRRDLIASTLRVAEREIEYSLMYEIESALKIGARKKNYPRAEYEFKHENANPPKAEYYETVPENKKEPEEETTEDELKSIVSGAIGKFNPDETNLLE